MHVSQSYLRGGQEEGEEQTTGSSRAQKMADATKRGAKAASEHAKRIAQRSSEGVRKAVLDMEDKMSNDAWSVHAFHTFIMVLVLTILLFAIGALFAKRSKRDKKLESAYGQYMRIVSPGALVGVLLGGIGGVASIYFMKQSKEIDSARGKA
jgi:hypothetical protein